MKRLLIVYLKYSERNTQGFTLLELLTVMVIVGILSAIALPSYLGYASRGKEAEAKSHIGAIVKAQQAFRIEQASFAPTAADLKIGLPTETTNYIYSVTGNNADALATATSKDPAALKSYAGGVVVLDTGATSTATCQTIEASSTPPTIDLSADSGALCSPGDGEAMQ